MNARTELLLSPNYNECTAIAFPKKGISAQNWDWSSKLEDNSVVIDINDLVFILEKALRFHLRQLVGFQLTCVQVKDSKFENALLLIA